MSIGRKVFHCVVDDTALTTSISDIKKWTSQGVITLIVPLYTLERLRSLKKAPSQTGMNARESVRFLDRVTSGKHSTPSSKVVLQGPMEQFEAWEEAENYLLPEFKEEVGNVQTPVAAPPPPVSIVEPEEKPIEVESEVAKRIDDLNEMSQMLLRKLNFKQDVDTVSANSAGTPSLPLSPMTASSHPSPEYTTRQLEGSQKNESSSVDEDDGPEPLYVNPRVPEDIKPLLNAVLWRLHAHPDAATAASGCILVTNNRSTQTWAQKFGIIVKNIPQLRTSIIYEEKEFKNHCKYLEKNPANEPKSFLSYDDESDEDVLVFVPRGQAKAEATGFDGRAPTNASPVAPRTAINGHVNGNAKTKVDMASEPQVEVPSTPIDPDSFNRNFRVTKQQGSMNPSNANNVNRGPPGHLPRLGGPNHRGAPRGGGMFRGPGRGRGKLWVP
ncbi:hypothetical protein PRK78_005105 [Emydomyces testavorans]|uniref:PIN domain-containing protein n=1 Tax=Emydomyces testavorans TaxID=2070801 RepID=A0AAF0DJ20_9EURO|nr:hypothetical protein PRK78_005105 [Emydomyces testavorans]